MVSTDTARQFTYELARLLPGSAKPYFSEVYNRYRERRADRSFSPTDRGLVGGLGAGRHVVVIVVDALRAETTNGTTTPYLHSLDHASAVTPAPWTFPAVSSILTGRYPHQHGATRTVPDEERSPAHVTVPSPVSPAVPTLPELFGELGYRTYGAFGLEMPFLALSGRFERHRLYRFDLAETVLDDHLRWLSGNSDGPTFSYIHLNDPHTPVTPPKRYVEDYGIDSSIENLTDFEYKDATELDGDVLRYVENRRLLYDASVNYVDDAIEAYVRRLEDELPTDPVVVVLGDHGEAFWEHARLDERFFDDTRPAYCVVHGGTPYEPIARVPFAVDGLDLSLRDQDGLISLVDLFPTLLSAVGVSDLPGNSGWDLHGRVPSDRVVLTEACNFGCEKKAVYCGEWKRIVSLGDGFHLDFGLRPERITEIPDAVAERMVEHLPGRGSTRDSGQQVSTIVERRLEELGYG